MKVAPRCGRRRRFAGEPDLYGQSGDTLSKISKQFYGDADEFMRIFYAIAIN